MEDLQEFKDFVSLEDLQKYIDSNMNITDKQLPKVKQETIERSEKEEELDTYEI